MGLAVSRLLWAAPLAVVAACSNTPMTEARAEALCRQDADLADGFRGNVGIGVGTGGARARGGITITNRVLNPQTEAEYVADCVDRRLRRAPQPVTYGISIGGRT